METTRTLKLRVYTNIICYCWASPRQIVFDCVWGAHGDEVETELRDVCVVMCGGGISLFTSSSRLHRRWEIMKNEIVIVC